MVEDARFEDASEGPLRLQALDEDSLAVISALVQDAVFPITEMKFQRAKRRFALLVNRFRWEDVPRAERQGQKFERVQSMLVFSDVTQVATQGIDRGDQDMICSLLSVGFKPAEDGQGRIELTLAGDGGIALEVECLDVTLSDVTRPYLAPSGHAPSHE